MHPPILFASAIVALSLSTVASQTLQTTPKASTASAPISIPFELITRHIIIPVRINNSRPLSFVLDTGDKYGIVNTETAKALGLLQDAQRIELKLTVLDAKAGSLRGCVLRA